MKQLQQQEKTDEIKQPLQPWPHVALLHDHGSDLLERTQANKFSLSLEFPEDRLFFSLHDRCANGLDRKALVDDGGGGGGGGGGMICGGEEYSNAYDGRRPSRRLPSRNEMSIIIIIIIFFDQSYQLLLVIHPANLIVIFHIHMDINISYILIEKTEQLIDVYICLLFFLRERDRKRICSVED